MTSYLLRQANDLSIYQWVSVAKLKSNTECNRNTEYMYFDSQDDITVIEEICFDIPDYIVYHTFQC